MRSAIRRLVKTGLIVAVAYLVAGNVFLNTPLGPWAINRKPERFELAWSHGMTWWPGFVALWNVQAKGHVRHVLWNASASRAEGRIAMLPLFSRELRLAGIDVTEVRVGVDRSDEEMLPPAARPGGWTLHFARIGTTTFRHARIVGVEVDANGSATFGFIKQLRGGPMEVLPSQVSLRDVEVRAGGDALLHHGTLDGDVAIARHLREQAPGLAKLGLTDAHLKIDGEVPGLAVDLASASQWDTALVADANGGRLEADLSLARGTLASGGRLELRVPLRATRNGAQLDEQAVVQATVGDSGVHLDVHLPPPPGDEGSLRASLDLAGSTIDLPLDAKAVLARTSGTLDIDWRFGSLEWLGPLLVKAPWLALEGAGRIDAALKVEAGRLAPGSRVEIPEVSIAATVAGHRFTGKARATGRLDAAGSGERAQVALAVARFDVAAADAPTVLLMRGNGLDIDLEASGQPLDFRETATTRIRFANAEVPDLKAINAWLPGEALAITGGQARLDADLALAADGRISRGHVGVHAQRASARLGALRLAGDFDLDGRIGGTDLAARHFDLDQTTLKLRNVRIIDEGRTAGEQWWANVTLEKGRIEAKRPFKIDADADIEMQNVGLLLALFTRHRDYPRWVLKLVDAGTMRATGRMAMDAGALVFDRVEARNDRFAMQARMRLAHSQAKGSLLLNWGVLGLGLEVDKDRHEFHVLRAREWFDAQPALIGR
jgi:hypothetical protein